MKRTRRPVVTLILGAPVAVLALTLSGCVAWAPQTAATPYEASDGSNAQIGGRGENGGVKLRNFLLVSADENAPGVLVGAIANDSGSPVEVTFTVEAAGTEQGQAQPLAQQTVTAQPGVLTKIGTGDGGQRIQVPSVPQPPGAVLFLTAETAEGSARMDLPILPPLREYASITPTGGAGAQGTPTPSPTESATESPAESPTTSDPAATPSESATE